MYVLKCCWSVCTFFLRDCVVCSSSIYGFWLPLWYLQTLLLTITTWPLHSTIVLSRSNISLDYTGKMKVRQHSCVHEYNKQTLFQLLNRFQTSFQPDNIVVSHRQPPYFNTGYTKESNTGTHTFIELWTDEKQTGDSGLVQSKGMKRYAL